MSYWQKLIALAREHDFLIFADECYAEIYDRAPPTGILEAAAETGSLANILSFHSLSKRSSLPGLRCGFVVGDAGSDHRVQQAAGSMADALALAGAITPPRQPGAMMLMSKRTARSIAKNSMRAERISRNRLGFYRPPGGFFLWLDVSETGLTAETATRKLYERGGVRVFTRQPISRARAANASGAPVDPGDNYVRLALVHDHSGDIRGVNAR